MKMTTIIKSLLVLITLAMSATGVSDPPGQAGPNVMRFADIINFDIVPEGSVTPGNILVYADREVRQCESTGISLEASAQFLIYAGIDVLQSTCGIRTGVAFPDVCGGRTADILAHEIRSVNLPDAEKLGFYDIRTLIDPSAGTNYQFVDCAEWFATS